MSVKDLCRIVLNHSTVRDVARLGLTCRYYRSRIFHNDTLWREVVINTWPHPSAWTFIQFEPDEALMLLLDMNDRSYIDRFMKWKFMETRLSAPPSSPLHLKLCMRIDTTDEEKQQPPIALISEWNMESVNVYHADDRADRDELRRHIGGYLGIGGVNFDRRRGDDGKLLISKIRENRLKKSGNDTFFRSDRTTNNNGLLEGYDEYDELYKEQEEQQHVVSRKRERRQIPYTCSFKFQKADKTVFPYWVEHKGTAYAGRVSRPIVYAIDRMAKGPIVVKDIGFGHVASMCDIKNDEKLVASVATHKGGLFDGVSTAKPYVAFPQSFKLNITVENLFTMYGPKQ